MLTLLVLGCSAPLQGVFVGDIPTTPGVLVALAAGETTVGLVVAGEGETLSWSRYYEGPRDEDGTFQLSSEGWTAAGGDVAGGGFSVTLTDADGREDPAFALQPPINNVSFDGPFKGSGGGGCVPSGVVFNSGGLIQGAACLPDGTRVPLQRTDTGLELSQAGTIEVAADLGNGLETLVLTQVLFEE